MHKKMCITRWGKLDQMVVGGQPIGWNDRFIVAKQHPSDNKSVINYFILDMVRDSQFSDPEVSVAGPLSVTEFKEKTLLLGLPAFTRDIKTF